MSARRAGVSCQVESRGGRSSAAQSDTDWHLMDNAIAGSGLTWADCDIDTIGQGISCLASRLILKASLDHQQISLADSFKTVQTS
ncbi:hypothetical protein J6590_025984 [Homalodisca vitripennis]|nr:hypothetical protein J6590_025984 [Homalodisca vitripennis]